MQGDVLVVGAATNISWGLDIFEEITVAASDGSSGIALSSGSMPSDLDIGRVRGGSVLVCHAWWGTCMCQPLGVFVACASLFGVAMGAGTFAWSVLFGRACLFASAGHAGSWEAGGSITQGNGGKVG